MEISDSASSIAQIASTLSGAVVGRRMWFCFCPELDVEENRLHATFLDEDPGMEDLLTLLDQAALRPGTRMLRGLIGFDTLGRPRLAAPGVERDELLSLAEWVGYHLADHPSLGHLGHATLVDVHPDGTVERYHREDRLWVGFPESEIPGTVSASGTSLEALREGHDAWFWMSDLDADAGSALVVVPKEEDPEARRLKYLIRGVRGSGIELSGVVRREPGGRRVFVTDEDVDEGRRILSLLLTEHPARLDCIRGACLAQTDERGVMATTLVSVEADLSREADVLRSLVPGDIAWFSFTDVYGADGRPMLFLEHERSRLLSAARGARCEGRETRGKVRMTAGGDVVFVSRKDFRGFVSRLAGWVAEHQHAWPELERLYGARFVLQDASGAVIRRERDESVGFIG